MRKTRQCSPHGRNTSAIIIAWMLKSISCGANARARIIWTISSSRAKHPNSVQESEREILGKSWFPITCNGFSVIGCPEYGGHRRLFEMNRPRAAMSLDSDFINKTAKPPPRTCCLSLNPRQNSPPLKSTACRMPSTIQPRITFESMNR